MSHGVQWQRTPQEVAGVLMLVVENCPSASNIHSLCSLLQVSRTVQQAMQQAVGHCSLVVPWPDHIEGFSYTIVRLSSCCSWLPKHAGLVKELSFSVGTTWSEDKDTAIIAHHVVNSALQLCAACAQAGAGLPFRLEGLTLTWDVLHPSVLEPLSVCTSVTRLDLTITLEQQAVCEAVYAAIGRLQGLQQFRLCNELGIAVLGRSFTDAISQLTGLLRLELGTRMQPPAVEAMPTSLQALSLKIADKHDWPALDAAPIDGLDLHHLVHLQELGLQCVDRPPHEYTTLTGLDPVLDAAGLQQLRSLHIADGLSMLPVVEQLSSLQKLQVLKLGLGSFLDTVAGNVEVLRACLTGVAAATQLTELSLVGSESVYDGHPLDLSSVHLHGYLAKLTQLQDLCISDTKLDPSDAVFLTLLKALTALHMHDVEGLDDTTAAAVACRLPNLRALDLVDCGVGTPMLLLVGLATGLLSLCIQHFGGSPPYVVAMGSTALGFLTGLTRLTSLVGPVLTASLDEYRAFRAALPALVDAPQEPGAD